jgi:hypothetical protein
MGVSIKVMGAAVAVVLALTEALVPAASGFTGFR